MMLRMIFKIILESLSVAVVLRLVTRKPMAIDDIVRVTLTTAAVLTVLAVLAPDVRRAAEKGMGIGVGLRQIGFPRTEGYSNWDALERRVKGKEAIEGFDENANHIRLNNVLYSGDLVNITGGVVGKTDQLYIQRNLTSSEVMLQAPVDGVHTNLSKLRFELVKHDAQVAQPIHYGDTVYIKHNANINNQNLDRFIKISNNLLSHQTGPLFNQFQIFNAASATDTSYVRPDMPVVIQNLASGGIAQGFLVVGSDNKLTNSAAGASDGTQFSIDLQRVAESGDRHLCICLKDYLYP